jgi:hypothetical protein
MKLKKINLKKWYDLTYIKLPNPQPRSKDPIERKLKKNYES